jgi:23S rRNA G2445 N2-methylase RlmL
MTAFKGNADSWRAPGGSVRVHARGDAVDERVQAAFELVSQGRFGHRQAVLLGGAGTLAVERAQLGEFSGPQLARPYWMAAATMAGSALAAVALARDSMPCKALPNT